MTLWEKQQSKWKRERCSVVSPPLPPPYYFRQMNKGSVQTLQLHKEPLGRRSAKRANIGSWHGCESLRHDFRLCSLFNRCLIFSWCHIQLLFNCSSVLPKRRRRSECSRDAETVLHGHADATQAMLWGSQSVASQLLFEPKKKKRRSN